MDAMEGLATKDILTAIRNATVSSHTTGLVILPSMFLFLGGGGGGGGRGGGEHLQCCFSFLIL